LYQKKIKLKKFQKKKAEFLRRLRTCVQKIENENCCLTKSSGWVEVKAVLWIADRNQKFIGG
jgi:hypothetical protein